MSTTVLAPTPALPPVRRPSMWEKMFGNFKMEKGDEDEMDLPLRSPANPTVQKTRLASVSTGVDQTNAYKRSGSIAMVKDTRSCSAPLPSPTKGRAASISNRRPSKSGRRPSWWRSANPETDADVPAVPAIDRKYSMFGSHNPDMEIDTASPLPSPSVSRRPSYVPRNAAASFLRTTTPLSPEEKAEVIRRASVADAMTNKTPVRPISHRPAPLNLKQDSLAKHGMHSMAGVCDISDDAASELVSPRGGTFSAASPLRSPAPRSPADTIMEADSDENACDSAKASPEMSAVKSSSTVAVVELTV